MYSKSLAMCQQPRSVKQKRNGTSACDNHWLGCVTWSGGADNQPTVCHKDANAMVYSRHTTKPIHTKWYISRISYPRFHQWDRLHIFLQTFAKQQKTNSTTPQLPCFFSHLCYISKGSNWQPPFLAAFLISAQGFQGFALELPSTKRGGRRSEDSESSGPPWRGADGLPWWCGYVQVTAWRWKIRGKMGGDKKAYGKMEW